MAPFWYMNTTRDDKAHCNYCSYSAHFTGHKFILTLLLFFVVQRVCAKCCIAVALANTGQMVDSITPNFEQNSTAQSIHGRKDSKSSQFVQIKWNWCELTRSNLSKYSTVLGRTTILKPANNCHLFILPLKDCLLRSDTFHFNLPIGDRASRTFERANQKCKGQFI